MPGFIRTLLICVVLVVNISYQLTGLFNHMHSVSLSSFPRNKPIGLNFFLVKSLSLSLTIIL